MKKQTKPMVVLTRKKSGLDYTIQMDDRGNLIALESGKQIAVSAKELDGIAVLAQALIDFKKADDNLDNAAFKAPYFTVGGHNVTYKEGTQFICVGCQKIEAKLVLRVHALSKARRSRKAAK